MRDFALEIRIELRRIQPKLSVEHADDLIRAVPQSYQDIMADNAEVGLEGQHEFFDFSHVDSVALASVFRETNLEIWIFSANDALIRSAEHLAMIDVNEFLRVVREQFHVSDYCLKFPMAEALPWLRGAKMD